MNKKQTIVRRTVAVGGACLTGLMLAACQSAANPAGAQPPAGSGQGNVVGAPLTLPAMPSPGPTGATTAAANTETNTGTGNGSSNPVKTVSPTKPAAPNSITACQGGQIQQSIGAGQSAASHFDIVLLFKNTSSVSCTLTGYAGAAVDYSNGTALNAQRQMTDYMGGDMADSAPQAILLAPGATASGLLAWNAGPTDAECLGDSGTAKLLVTTPGTANTVTEESSIGGTCANFTVTPVVPGSNGEKSS